MCRFAKFVKRLSLAISYCELKDKRINIVDPDEVAHVEPPHQDFHYL